MAITRKLVAHDDNDNQWLKVDHATRYIENHSSEWQFIFGPDSVLSNGSQVVKLTAKFDEVSFDSIQIAAYLYDPKTGAISNAANCSLTVYKVIKPNWTEELITPLPTSQLPNYYFYAAPTTSSLGVDFQGGDTIMVEAVITRLGITYRDRVYFNHLGVYDNITRVRQDVEFLDINKKDV